MAINQYLQHIKIKASEVYTVTKEQILIQFLWLWAIVLATTVSNQHETISTHSYLVNVYISDLGSTSPI